MVYKDFYYCCSSTLSWSFRVTDQCKTKYFSLALSGGRKPTDQPVPTDQAVVMAEPELLMRGVIEDS